MPRIIGIPVVLTRGGMVETFFKGIPTTENPRAVSKEGVKLGLDSESSSDWVETIGIEREMEGGGDLMMVYRKFYYKCRDYRWRLVAATKIR